MASLPDRTVIRFHGRFKMGRTKGESWYSSIVPVRSCRVSFTDTDGIRHAVSVQAESLYEAVVLAIRAFQGHHCAPGPASQLEVEVQSPSVTHTLTMAKVRAWLEGATKKEKITKERLKALLAS